MPLLKWIVVALAAAEALWMAFDGIRALWIGDYVTPRSGPRQGQLGPWATIVAWIGIDPRSTGMKSLFVVYGLAWLAVIAAFVCGVPLAGWLMAAAAAGSLWYAPVGTALGLIQLILLVGLSAM